MYKIYIVEDDSVIASVIAAGLEKWHFECHIACGFGCVDRECAAIQPHLVLMDINLPQYDGFYWCTQIRKSTNVPIMFISSRTDDNDKIRAIMGGGDDYIEKPFSMDVLVAKVQAMLRRTYAYADSAYSTVSYGELMLDIEKLCIFCGGRDTLLTHNECTIMTLLMRAGGCVVSRAKMIKTLWEDESFVDENTLSVNVARLRQKLKDLTEEDLIATVKGKGYRLV